MLERLRRSRERTEPPLRREPFLSFGSWDAIAEGSVVQICHPDWRGVRSAAYAFRSPVIECDNLSHWGDYLISELVERTRLVVIQGWPPGAAEFAEQAARAGIEIKCVLHSSPVQHGGVEVEAAVADTVLELARRRVLTGVGMVKEGVAEAFSALGFPVVHLPNRVPEPPRYEKLDLGPSFNVGVFAEPIWRKNVTTQLLAVALLDGAKAHVLRLPDNLYLRGLKVVEHGVLPFEEFLPLQSSVDLNLYVTLSECHPFTPMESYMAGVPCLMSRTSGVFRTDRVLWELTTVDEVDNPRAIAAAARRLLRSRDEALERAKAWMTGADDEAQAAWRSFTEFGQRLPSF